MTPTALSMASALLVSACASAAPEVRERREDEPAVPMVLELGVDGADIVASSSSGGICDGVITGTLAIDAIGSEETQRIEVRAATMEERCPNCLGDGPCPCERGPVPFIRLARLALAVVGDYAISGSELTISCAAMPARFVDVSVAYDGLTLRERRDGEPPTVATVAVTEPAPVAPAPAPDISTPVPPAEHLEVVVRELGTDRPLRNVRVTIVEVQACALPRGGGGPPRCTPRTPRRLRGSTGADGVVGFALPAPRTGATSEPAGLHYVVLPFRARGFVGPAPYEDPIPVAPGTRLEAWEPLAAPAVGQRVTYWLVPQSAVSAASGDPAP